jgi:hypothetical protein
MGVLRFAAVALAAFLAVITIQWLSGRPPNIKLLQPAFHRVDVNSPREKLEASDASDNDSVRDGLRHALMDAAEDLAREPCNKEIKARYVEAATKYVRAWLSVVPCLATKTCGSSDSPRLDRAQQAFGSPLDHRVREAMKIIHRRGAFVTADFPHDAVGMVAMLAADPVINPQADPSIKQATQDMRPPFSCRAASLR